MRHLWHYHRVADALLTNPDLKVAISKTEKRLGLKPLKIFTLAQLTAYEAVLARRQLREPKAIARLNAKLDQQELRSDSRKAVAKAKELERVQQLCAGIQRNVTVTRVETFFALWKANTGYGSGRDADVRYILADEKVVIVRAAVKMAIRKSWPVGVRLLLRRSGTQ